MHSFDNPYMCCSLLFTHSLVLSLVKLCIFFSKKIKDKFFNLNVGFPLLSNYSNPTWHTIYKVWTSILYHSSWSICFLAMVYETKSFFLIHHKYVQLDSYQGFGQPGKTYYIISFLSTFYHPCCMNGWTALHKM